MLSTSGPDDEGKCIQNYKGNGLCFQLTVFINYFVKCTQQK